MERSQVSCLSSEREWDTIVVGEGLINAVGEGLNNAEGRAVQMSEEVILVGGCAQKFGYRFV